MTFVVTDNCIKCKFTDCVIVCPVDAFHEGENFLAINPDICIDCAICEPECPVDAIRSDRKLLPEDHHWLDFNKEMSKVGAPVITKVKDPMPTFEQAASYTADEQWSKVSRIPFVKID